MFDHAKRPRTVLQKIGLANFVPLNPLGFTKVAEIAAVSGVNRGGTSSALTSVWLPFLRCDAWPYQKARVEGAKSTIASIDILLQRRAHCLSPRPQDEQLI